jgi:hypothetical protein
VLTWFQRGHAGQIHSRASPARTIQIEPKAPAYST